MLTIILNVSTHEKKNQTYRGPSLRPTMEGTKIQCKHTGANKKKEVRHTRDGPRGPPMDGIRAIHLPQPKVPYFFFVCFEALVYPPAISSPNPPFHQTQAYLLQHSSSLFNSILLSYHFFSPSTTYTSALSWKP